jgi:hypothetical protein
VLVTVQITVEAHRNEISDQSGLIARYQQEVALLRKQLEMVMKDGGGGGGAAVGVHDPLHPEVRTLRERLEEEHMALVEKERERARLEGQVERLTGLVLHGAAAATQMERRLKDPYAAEFTGAEAGTIHAPDVDVPTVISSIRDAGDLIPGRFACEASSIRSLADIHEVEADLLRKQVYALCEELKERERIFRTVNHKAVDAELEEDVTLQVMMAEREYMKSQFDNIDGRNAELATALERMRHMVRSLLDVACTQAPVCLLQTLNTCL